MPRFRAMPACMRCGSLELRSITGSEGPVGFGAELDLKHCQECDWQGRPLEFASEADWKAFRDAQRQPV